MNELPVNLGVQTGAKYWGQTMAGNVVLILSQDQYDKLVDLLTGIEDKGPFGETWTSKEAIELYEVVTGEKWAD